MGSSGGRGFSGTNQPTNIGFNPWQGPSSLPSYGGITQQDRGVSGVYSTRDQKPSIYEQNLGRNALAEGPSDQTRFLMGAQKMGQNTQLGQAAMSAQGAAADARSAMGRTGGYNSGAGNRLAMQSMNNAQSLQQGIRGAGEQSRLGLLAGGEAQRQASLENLANMQNSRMMSDVNASRGDQLARNAFNADLFNSQMQGWGAGQSANAQARAGGGK